MNTKAILNSSRILGMSLAMVFTLALGNTVLTLNQFNTVGQIVAGSTTWASDGDPTRPPKKYPTTPKLDRGAPGTDTGSLAAWSTWGTTGDPTPKPIKPRPDRVSPSSTEIVSKMIIVADPGTTHPVKPPNFNDQG